MHKIVSMSDLIDQELGEWKEEFPRFCEEKSHIARLRRIMAMYEDPHLYSYI